MQLNLYTKYLINKKNLPKTQKNIIKFQKKQYKNKIIR